VGYDMKAGHGMKGMSERGHHAMMIADFRRRFWVSLVLTIPILALSPLIQRFMGVEGKIAFPGDSYLLFALSSVVYFYGGWPFLKGIFSELKSRSPAMMTLIAVAITTAYAYSTAVVFGLARMVTVMVIACPHALGLAIPLVVAISTSLSARSGLLIKNRDGFECQRRSNFTHNRRSKSAPLLAIDPVISR
jgi:cation transport ATPase